MTESNEKNRPRLRLADSFFGSIALKNRMLTRAQLAEALRVQWERSQGGIGPNLGEICIQLGFLSPDKVSAVLEAQLESELLLEETLCGHIAVRNGLISQQQLDSALALQRAEGPGARLGHIFITRGELTAQQVHAVLTSQQRMKDTGKFVEQPTITPGETEPVKPKPTKKKARKRKDITARAPAWDNAAMVVRRDRENVKRRKAELRRSLDAARRAKRAAEKAAAQAEAELKNPKPVATAKTSKKVAKKTAKKAAKKTAKKTAKKKR